MKNVLLSSLVMAAVFSGCGGSSSCCDGGLVTTAIGVPPVAKITGVANPTTISLGQSVTANGIASSDRDGNVVEYKWTLDGTDASNEQSPTFTFNTPGEHELCLSVVDNDEQESVNMECRTIKVLGENDVTPVLPTAVIDITNEDDMSVGSLHTFTCENSHDNDSLGDGEEIVSCEWNVQSYAIDDNGNEVPYRNCTADIVNGGEFYICTKATKIIAKLTVIDNDSQVASTTKTYKLK